MGSSNAPPVVGPGHRVGGRYRLRTSLGGGAMGAVWLAFDELLGREVALKQALVAHGLSEEATEIQRQRALREGRIAARLRHPHAISMYDVALHEGEPWLVMEYLPGSSLSAVTRLHRVLPWQDVARIGAQVADAMAAAHAVGIVHRDIKPGNVLVGHDGGTVKISDFGISHAGGDVVLTQTGMIRGTPAYFAPEVARGHDATGASDVFSLAATLHACVEGAPPFGDDDNPLALLRRVALGETRPPRNAGAMTPVLLRMLEPDPRNRPAMAEVRDELAHAASGGSGAVAAVLPVRVAEAHPVPGPAHRAGRPVRTGRVARRSVGRPLAWSLVLAVLVVSAVSVFVVSGGGDGTQHVQQLGPPRSSSSTTASEQEDPA